MNKKIFYLTSDDIFSKQFFKNNSNSNFTIQLPHNFNFKTNATICLKSIFIPNAIKNKNLDFRDIFWALYTH